MRYGIYFVPASSTELYQFGASVIGYDVYSGTDVPGLEHIAFATERAAAWRKEPQRYGFHATLKAPFELLPGATSAQVLALAGELASRRSRFVLPALRVALLSRFLALVPQSLCPELQQLADACVRAFEPLRAPLSESDRQRRRASQLTLRQIEHLDAWGYPYVFDDYRFHMTLTGPLAIEDQRLLTPVLETLWASHKAPVEIDAIAVVVQPSRDARFKVLERYALKD